MSKADNSNTKQSKRGLFGWFKRKPEAEAVQEQPEQQDESIVEEALSSQKLASPETIPQVFEPHKDVEEQQDTATVAQATPTGSSTGMVATSNDGIVPETQSKPEDNNESSFFKRLKSGLSKTRDNFSSGISSLVLGKKVIDDELLEDIETQLLMADVGIEATATIIKDLTERTARKELADADALMHRLTELLSDMIAPVAKPLILDTEKHHPFVILVVGVNGVGKTTTIGKLAQQLKQQGLSVMLAAGDTFRAAAVEQLQVWGQRNEIPVVAQHEGADSASVIFDAVQSAVSKQVDVIIADTAGRLHTKSNLMDELTKVKRVIQKIDGTAPHEVMLVIDAGTGQNALNQAEQFHEAVGLTGLTLTKLDGTAKGGVVFALANKLNVPIRFIGVGEGLHDLRPFDADEFIDALFNK